MHLRVVILLAVAVTGANLGVSLAHGDVLHALVDAALLVVLGLFDLDRSRLRVVRIPPEDGATQEVSTHG